VVAAETSVPRKLKAEHLLLDWAPLLLLIAVYEGLRDLVPLIGASPHNLAWVDLDLFGGQLPTTWLQTRFYQARPLGWEDSVATTVYFLYYLVPLVVGLLWWLRSRTSYYRYAGALLTLCALAFITYVVMPTVPPWLAYPHSVHEITDATIAEWNLPSQLVSIYLHHDYDLDAAFPSLHAAFPVVLIYYGWMRSRPLGALMAVYASLVWLAIVFLGEHYVVDILGGIAYAIVAIVAVETVARRRIRRRTQTPAGVSTSEAAVVRT